MAMRYVGLRVGIIAAVLARLAVAAGPQAVASSTPSAPAFAFATVGNGTLAVFWAPVLGATKYEVAYTSDNGANWHSYSNNLTGTKVTISGVDYTLVYMAWVRAGNGNGWSGWKGTNATAPWSTERVVSTPIDDDSKNKLNELNKRLRGYWGGNWGQAAPDPTAATYMSVSNVASSSATLTLHHYDGAWSYNGTANGTALGCTDKSSGTTTVNLAGRTPETSHSFKAYPGSGCSGEAMAFADFTTKARVYLSVSGITSTGATLTLNGHTGTWHYKEIHPTAGTCTFQTAASKTLTLTANKTYAYTAYSDSTCSTALATAYFSTTDAFVGNLGTATATGTVGNALGSELRRATAFTTGNATNGYELKGVTLQFNDKFGSPANIVVAIHAQDTGNSSNPAATASITLSGSNPDTAGLYTYTCSTSCDLSRNTTYFVVVSAPDDAYDPNTSDFYRTRLTTSNDETPYPSGSGWSIADEGRVSTYDTWSGYNNGATGVMHVAADEKLN